MSLSKLSPLQTAPPQRLPRLPQSQETPAESFESSGSSRKSKILAGTMLGITGLGALAGAGLHQAAHAPICQQTQQVVGWESGPCVSQSLGVGGATAWRYLQTPGHLPGALNSWNSGRHQVIAAPNQAENTQDAQNLKVLSWNLHHGVSQDSTGARPQLETMIDTLQEQDADVLLLQEVNPKDASRLAEELGMQGFYAASTPVQGNMILLRPDFEVGQESVTVTTGQDPSQATTTLKDWLLNGGGSHEPRTLQILDVKLPNGQPAVLWNTHHLTGTYSPEQHQESAQIVQQALQERIQPGELVIGGGDLNANRASHPLLAGLEQIEGVRGEGQNIDWIYSSQSMESEFFHQRVEHQGVMVSDHPLVGAQLRLPG